MAWETAWGLRLAWLGAQGQGAARTRAWAASWVFSKVTGQRSGGQTACRALGSQCASCARASARRSGLPAARRGLGGRQLPSTDVGHSRCTGAQAGRRRPARRNLTVLAHGILPNPAPGLPARGKPGQSDPLGHHLLHGAGRQRCALSPAPHLLRAALYLPPARLCHCARAARICRTGAGPRAGGSARKAEQLLRLRRSLKPSCWSGPTWRALLT